MHKTWTVYICAYFQVGILSTGDSLDMTLHDESLIVANDATVIDMEVNWLGHFTHLLGMAWILMFTNNMLCYQINHHFNTRELNNWLVSNCHDLSSV